MHPRFKYGKKPPKPQAHPLRFAKYLTAAAFPALAKSYSWIPMTEWGMMLNDTEGDCTFAACGHFIQLATAYTFRLYTPPDSSIQTGYIAVTGQEGAAYNPATGANDNGCAMSDVLAYMQNTGIDGHKIDASMSLDLNIDQLKMAIQLFGFSDIGINVPAYLENLFDTPDIPWDAPKPGDDTTIQGGHDIIVPKFDDAIQMLTFVSWGQLYKMTYAAWKYLCDEAYAVLMKDFFFANNKNIVGFDYPTLLADLQAIISVQ